MTTTKSNPSTTKRPATSSGELRRFDAGADRSVPAEACRGSLALAGSMRFADGVDESTADLIPFEMFGRSPDVIDHWYWGPIVHDMAGAKWRGTIPIDWCHDYDETLGYGDRIRADNSGLTVAGNLVPFGPDDRGREIAYKGKRGVPWQASIDWSGGPAVLEVVDFGASAEANGRIFAGPVTIVREWWLSAMAVCPHGADGATTTTFSGAAGDVGVSVIRKTGVTMGDQDNGGAQGDAVFSRETAQRWRDRFGDRGLAYLMDGTSWDEAIEAEHTRRVSALEARLADQATAFEAERSQSAARLAELEAENAKLRQQLSAAGAVARTDDAIPGLADKTVKPRVFNTEKRAAA